MKQLIQKPIGFLNVSILVVMDLALQPGLKNPPPMKAESVSILVVMDLALQHDHSDSFATQHELVSILVVMDLALQLGVLERDRLAADKFQSLL